MQISIIYNLVFLSIHQTYVITQYFSTQNKVITQKATVYLHGKYVLQYDGTLKVELLLYIVYTCMFLFYNYRNQDCFILILGV